jgi:hypothetical protein
MLCDAMRLQVGGNSQAEVEREEVSRAGMLQSTLQPFVSCLTGSTVAIMQEREALISELQAALTPEVAQQVGEILDQSLRFSHPVRCCVPCV